MPAPDLPAVVAIPTYRRPDKLGRLLRSLEPSLRRRPARVIVGDNASDPATAEVVRAFAQAWPGVDYLPVPERGIAANRNALVEAFLRVEGAPHWLAMVDDDLLLPPDWLELMLACGGRHGADVVGGPYAMRGLTGHAVVDASIFVRRPRQPSGPCAPLAAAGNILLSRRLLERPAALRFRAEYGLSGGEDYDFFRAATRAGASFAWCDEALAEEDVDTNRLNAATVLMRYYSTGNYMALIDKTYEPVNYVRRWGALAKATAIAMEGVVKARRERMLQGAFLISYSIGALAGLAGLRTYRYR